MRLPFSLTLCATVILAVGCRSTQTTTVNGTTITYNSKSQAPTDKSSQPLLFLADIPALHDITMKTSESHFLKLLHKNNIQYTRTIGPDNGHYYSVFPRPHVVVLFGYLHGQCNGVQRLAN